MKKPTMNQILADMETALLKLRKEAIQRKAVYISLGLQLLAAKERLPHGSFLNWLAARFDGALCPRIAQYYMQLAKRFLRSEQGAVYFAMSPDQLVHALKTEESLSQAMLDYAQANPGMKAK